MSQLRGRYLLTHGGPQATNAGMFASCTGYYDRHPLADIFHVIIVRDPLNSIIVPREKSRSTRFVTSSVQLTSCPPL